MKIVTKNSLTLSNVNDGTGIANVTNFYLASNQSTGIEKPADVVNLIRNGAYPTNTNYWSGAMIVSQHGFYYNGQKKLFLLATTGPSEIIASSYRFEVKRNTNYSLSFYALAGGNVKGSDVFFLGRKSNETNDFTSVNLIIENRRFSGSKAEYVTITFNSGDNDNGYIRFDNNGSSDGINAVLFFGEVMLVEGREPKPWVAAIEDSGWTRIPQQTTYANRFLWNYRIELYSDGVTKSIEPTVIGVYGEMGKSVWSYPYDRGANRLGSWWSDLKPTPTTDNPPKVGDTIIDLVGKIYQITNVVVGTAQQGGGVFDYGSMLTSVKGADGLPSYSHTAYSWSADGTDRFTTVYPNLNLGDNTKTFVGAEGGNNLSGSIRIDPATQKTQDGDFNYLTYKPTTGYTDWFHFFLIPQIATPNMTKVAVKPNTKYTFSVLLKGTGQHTIYAYNNWTSQGGSQTINLTSNWTLYTCMITSSNVIPAENVQFFIRSNAGTEINLKYPKVEEGSIATPYMPSSSEVKTSDYPNYIGTYSDSNVESSSDYSKYQWAIFKGQNSNAYTAYSWSSDGSDRFTTTYPNLNLLDGSKKYTKDNPKTVSSSATDGVFFLNDVFVKNLKAGTYTMSGKSDAPWVSHYSNPESLRQGHVGLWLVSTTQDLNVNISLGDTVPKTINVPKDGDYCVRVNTYSNGTDVVTHSFWDFKLEQGSIATPWMPSESESQDQWQDAIPMYIGVGEKDSQNPSDYRWQLNSKYVQASSDSGLSNKAGVDDLASVANTANNALVQAQNAVSNEDYTSWLEHGYQSTIKNLQDVSAQNQKDIKNVDDRTTIVEGFYGEMKVKWNFIDESFSFSEEGMFISNAQSKMSIQITSDKIVFWDNNIDVAFITGEVLNIQKGVFLESATIGNHLITKFSNDSPVTIIRYVGGIT